MMVNNDAMDGLNSFSKKKNTRLEKKKLKIDTKPYLYKNFINYFYILDY